MQYEAQHGTNMRSFAPDVRGRRRYDKLEDAMKKAREWEAEGKSVTVLRHEHGTLWTEVWPNEQGAG